MLTNRDALARANEIVRTTNTTDFRVQSYTPWRLLLIGSMDLDYYHEVELEFRGVSYVELHTLDVLNPEFAVAMPEERGARRARLDVDADDVLFKITVWQAGRPVPPPYWIVARDVELREGLVYHYARANLQAGERIASWVRGPQRS